jgi:hypothetical protein
LNTAPDNFNMNRGVREILSSIKEIRLKHGIQLNESNKRLGLDEIYRIIEDFKALETVNKQIDSIRESRRSKMKAYEYRIETNLFKNKTFTQLTNSFQ